MEWKEQLISTDVDKLLEYLTAEDTASVSQAAEDLNVSEERINSWAEALIDANLIERSYSTTKGKMLHIADKEKAEEKIEEVHKETQQEAEQARQETDPRKKELQQAWETIEDLLKALKKQKKVRERIEDDLTKLQSEEDKLTEKLEDNDHQIEEELLAKLQTIEKTMKGVETIEEEIDKFKERRKTIESNLKALKKLEEHRKELKKKEMEGYKCETCGRIFDTERGLHVHQSQVHDDNPGLIGKIRNLLKPG